MKVYMLDNSVKELIECKPNEWKVLIAMVSLANNNVVDLLRRYNKLVERTELSDKSIETAITGLKKKGILVKTGLPRVWFIEPSYFMKGYYAKIYAISKLIEEKDRGLLEKIDAWEEEERALEEERRLKGRWEVKRAEQASVGAQEKIVDKFTDVDMSRVKSSTEINNEDMQ